MTDKPLKTDRDLFALLDSLGIPHETTEHEAVFTVGESERLRGIIAGAHTKNLFLRDRKDRHFVVTAEEYATVDLKGLHRILDASGRLSFGKPETMWHYLGVTPGSVTVFSAINDIASQVTFVLDEGLMRYDRITGHPLRNTATTSVGRDDLIRFLKATGHTPLVLKVAD
ncbi:prolyl-tRNA synthetase associated domain-containing protein [Rhizobiaceae bacterium BDR2-2]|uniref:Prolyl-tRNA synthetase associated domain-containing protein n=1 Tax=Ectorhizobium quercum TaxID=2965071 RepID=A0AAE3N1L1_9HYPH|nr:YbaK/EbsC family protein [Ectorhizobium quercum]MCX8999288.1 prolyl-tRNA synthetase associated domain-containing protein [Ectorhizobium quercum]